MVAFVGKFDREEKNLEINIIRNETSLCEQ